MIVDLSQLNPPRTRIALRPEARGRAWAAVVIKPRIFHAPRYGCSLTHRNCACVGFFAPTREVGPSPSFEAEGAKPWKAARRTLHARCLSYGNHRRPAC